MNPKDEVRRLTDLFPHDPPLISDFDHVPSSQTPEPYHTLLVHEHHMTVTMESFHGTSVNLRVIDETTDGDAYSRCIVLERSDTGRVVQFGIVRFDLRSVTDAVKSKILTGDVPLGRILIRHNILRHIDPGAILRLTTGPDLAKYLKIAESTETWGRLATIFCNNAAAVDLLEISAPVTMP